MSGPARVCIVGAGLAGSLLACSLARQGRRVVVVEKRPDPRLHGFAGGRSINLALSARGLLGLSGVGLAEKVLAQSIPMRGRMVHSPTGELAFQPYSKSRADAINSVSRADLNLTLIEAAAAAGAEFRFGLRCADIDPQGPAALVEPFETGPDTARAARGAEPIAADLVLGADGAYSAVRQWMQRQDRFDFSQDYLAHGYKELRIPPARECGVPESRFRGFAMDPHALHIWPRGGSMMIALPNPDLSFTCTCFWPIEGPGGLNTLTHAEHIEAHFERYAPDARPLMPALVEDFLRNPVGSLVTIRCRPWSLGGRVAVLGDAAHAIVPFFGQGMNCAFEDCRALAACLERHADTARALAEFERERKPNADAIADLALENFIEMRDRTASRVFRAKKHAEHALHRWFPRWYEPLYYMISFTTIPYHEARVRAWRQGSAMRVIGLVAAMALVLAAVIAARAAGWLEARDSALAGGLTLCALAVAMGFVLSRKPPWSTTYPPR